MSERYRRYNRRKFCLKVHLVLVCKYRKHLLFGEIDCLLKQKIHRLCKAHQWALLAMETDADHVHLLIEYDTTESVCSIVRTIKQETTYELWLKCKTILQTFYWKKQILWSDGYFACSIGDVSTEIIQKYIESQG